MPEFREGQTATNPKTGQTVVYKGGQWVAAPSAPGAPAPVARKLSPQDNKMLNEAHAAAQEAGSIQRDYQEADAARKRLGTGPWWGSFLDAAIPVEDGGFLDSLGGFVIGGIPRLTGAIDQGDVDAYNTLRRVQARRVLAEQKQQKGVQTEGDAARIKAGDIGVRMSETANDEAIARGMAESKRLISRDEFYTRWANTYGLNGVDQHGRNVESAFNDYYNRDAGIVEKPSGAPAAPIIRRVQ